jgi:glucan phosphoethanolaminetransferase (alkaline phosphatase superfamily)
MMSSAVSLLRRVGLDLLLWCCAPVLFLFVYVERHGLSGNSALPHLKLVLTAWLAVASIRVASSRILGHETVSRVAATALLSAAWLLMLAYYAAVLIGLESWGQVISWDLIASYVVQLPALADALGIPMTLVVLVPIALAIPIALGAWYALKKYDWTPLLRPYVSNWLVAVMFVAAAAVVASELVTVAGGGTVSDDEPVALTVFPHQSARTLQDHSIDRRGARKLDAIEDAARSSYTTATLQSQPPNVVLIVVDALRPDHLGTYGYARDTTPSLDRLSQSGQMRAINGVHAACTESSCGLLSLISSKYIHEFSDRPFTLHEVLRRHGYRVHLILGGDHTHFYGLKEAYGDVDSYIDGSGGASAYYANDDRFVIDRASSLPAWDGRPVLLQFHLMSAHALGKRHPESLQYLPFVNYALPGFRGESDREAFVNYYDNGVAQSDRMIGALLDVLAHKQYLTKTLVVVTADHGEALGEHGDYSHSHTVREESLKIPLMFVPFGFRLQEMAERRGISQVDIAPTILTELGLPLPSSWSGVPLQQADARPFTFFQQKRQIGLIDRRSPDHLWKYWVDRSSGAEFAFDLVHDPHETSNATGGSASGLLREWRAALLKLRPSTDL